MRGDDLIATIEAIHAAGLDADLWPTALARAAEVGCGVAATLEVFDRTTLRHRAIYSWGLASAEELSYVEHFAAINPRLPFVAKEPLDALIWDRMFLSEETMRRDPFYAEFLKQIEVRCFVGAIVASADDEFAGFCIHRAPKQGHVDRAGIAVMRRLAPHVRQAFDVARRLDGADELRQSLERSLDWLADGVLLVRNDGAVLYANQAMQAIARDCDGLRLKNHRIEFAASAPSGQLAAAISAIGRLRSGDAGSAPPADFPVARPSRAPPYVVSVRPLLGRRDGVPGGAAAIVFVRDPARRHAAAISMLREVLGLTEAEANFACALQAGMTLSAYARAHAISLNTVYTHLRALKEKTGYHRLPELISRLNDLRVPWRLS
jgi:DNA-binding CsgD family transcriptional regulator